MNELADPDVSELHQLASKKSQKARESLEKYESFRGTISEQMGCVLEYNTLVEELKNVEAIIRDEEEGGHGSLKEFESQLSEQEASLSEKKELVTELQSLMTLVSVESRKRPCIIETHFDHILGAILGANFRSMAFRIQPSECGRRWEMSRKRRRS